MITAREACYRNIFAVDVEGSTTRNNRAKARMRDAMYGIVTESFTRSSVTEAHRDPFIDCGDGLLTLLPPSDEVPKTLLLQSVVPTLGRLIAAHNARQPADRLRLRAVLHADEVHYDSRGPFGEALDVAFRLLNSPHAKLVLRRTAAPLVLAVSGDVYQSVVRHQYDGIDPQAFTRFVAERNATTWDEGWLNVPGQATPPPVAPAPREHRGRRRPHLRERRGARDVVTL